jgi:hypothetical protein
MRGNATVGLASPHDAELMRCVIDWIARADPEPATCSKTRSDRVTQGRCDVHHLYGASPQGSRSQPLKVGNDAA